MTSNRTAPKTHAGALFLDANVLMYAAGSEHPLRKPCRDALERAVGGGIALVTDSEVLQELLYRYCALRRPDLARLVYTAAVELCREVLPVAEAHTARALALLEEHPTLPARDAVHLAIMEAAGITRILSTDKHFDLFGHIERVDPRALDPL